MMKRLVVTTLIFGALAFASPQVAAAAERNAHQYSQTERRGDRRVDNDRRVDFDRRGDFDRRPVIVRRIGDRQFGYYDVHGTWCWY